jgi:hypothetical protein
MSAAIDSVRRYRPYRAIASSYAGSFDVRGDGGDGVYLGFHFHDKAVAEQFAAALNGEGPGPNDPLTASQARAFLASLWPEGENSYRASYARTYFEALVGVVPRPGDALSTYAVDGVLELASMLSRLADALRAIHANQRATNKTDLPF